MLLIPIVIIFMYGAQKNEVNEDKIVHNGPSKGWRVGAPLKLELVRTLGGAESNSSEFVVGTPADAVMDSAGNIYILDSKNVCILKVNPEGRLLKTIGSRGQGPMDFISIGSLDIDDQDHLYVGDVVSGVIKVISQNGDLLDTFIMKKRGSRVVRWIETNVIAMGGAFLYNEIWNHPDKLPKLIQIVNHNGDIVRNIGDSADYQDPFLTSFANQIYFVVDKERNYYLSFVYQNRIEKLDKNGNRAWQADRHLNYSTKVIDKGGAEHSAKGSGYVSPKMNQVSLGIAVDGKKRIWVITFERQPAKSDLQTDGRGNIRKPEEQKSNDNIQKIEIFGEDGRLYGEIRLNHAIHGIRIFGNSLILWERNNAVVYCYRIIETSQLTS